ncbi:MAG: GNAT family N-acetyltransferase [Thaumarchaeota archaeon]|nr:GNAT family N-acetyltransferase [Nitrososphaerota archaeon]
MDDVVVRRGTRADTGPFLRLLGALADFEHLEPPTQEGKKRIIKDIFVNKRVNLLMAQTHGVHVGYALYFYTYSSFLARPTLYIEDLFVLEAYRKHGIGLALFRRCAEEAIKTECGRMEWSVLGWNTKAIVFYEGLGARHLREWQVFRLTRDKFGSASLKAS